MLLAAIIGAWHIIWTEVNWIVGLPLLTTVTFSIILIIVEIIPARWELIHIKRENPLEVAGQDKVELAFKKEENAPVFENMIDGWEYRVTMAIAKRVRVGEETK